MLDEGWHDDPQRKDDEAIQRVRKRLLHHEMTVKARDIATLWQRQSAAEECQAHDLAMGWAPFDAAVKIARSQVRRAAAIILRESQDPDKAAQVMHGRAAALRQDTNSAPLIGFDEVALNYIRARTWQACAHTLNPDLPEIQPCWD